MQENALFLDLVAKELTVAREGITPEEMIKRLANNPANLFSFALERLERTPEWDIIEQVLGLLLASREPLSLQQLRHLIGVKEYRLRSAISRLGGLLTESVPKERSEHRLYSLFHLMFQDFMCQRKHEPERDYLFTASDVEQYHSHIAQWCEGEQLALIWQDTTEQVEQARRAYARQHYITHLFLAKLWPHLFDILDDGSYGRAKVQNDPSMRSYTLDLELGRLASASEGWTLDQGIAHLPLLWRYTLLQCSLASRADLYPDEAIQLLLLLRQEAKAIGLAELLTNASHKVKIFIDIASHLAKQPDRNMESMQLFIRANEVTKTIEDADTRGSALSELGQALAQAQQWDRAEAVWHEAISVAPLWKRIRSSFERGTMCNPGGQIELVR